MPTVYVSGKVPDIVDVEVELDDVIENLSQSELTDLFWDIVDLVWDDVKNELRSWYEDD